MLKPVLTLMLLSVALPATAQDDPVADCRDRHATDAEAHIACLEAALNALRDEPEDLGAEQVEAARRAKDDADASAEVRIISTTYDSRGLGTFQMADGQVWRETSVSPDHKRLDPEREYDARIVRSIMGGYRLHVDGVRHMKTVRRVE